MPTRYVTDVVLEDAAEGTVGYAIAAKLAAKGFCVVDGVLRGTDADSVRAEVAQLAAGGQFTRTPTLIAEGLLGSDASEELAEAPAPGPALQAVDATFDTIGNELAPFCDVLGFSISHRGRLLVHRTAEDMDDAPELSEALAAHWLGTFARHRVMAVVYVGPASAVLEIQPFGAEDTAVVNLTMNSGSMVVLRPDVLSHRLHSKGKAAAMTCFFLQQRRGTYDELDVRSLPPAARELETWVQDRLRLMKSFRGEAAAWDPALPRDWQLMMNHLYHKGQMMGVYGAAYRGPTAWDSEGAMVSYVAGVDVATEVPQTRWDHSLWYEDTEDCWTRMHSYTKHCSFMEGIAMGDPKVFGLSMAEWRGIDPGQRFVLETGYESTHKAGYRKRDLMNSVGGIFVGWGCTEWGFAEKCAEVAASFSGTGVAASIISNRFSFVFGMKGPSMTVDSEMASAHCALHLCAESVTKKGRGLVVPFSLAVGGAANYHPMFWSGKCAAGELAREGRCFAFDESAQGYILGDAFATVLLKPLADIVDGDSVACKDSRVGALAGSTLNASGGGASLTAPNGVAQQEVIAQAVRNACLSIFDVDVAEAHGRAKVLDDAIEVSSWQRALRTAECPEPLPLSNVHANNGAPLQASGIVSLLKALHCGLYGCVPPIPHMRRLNPLVDGTDNPVGITTELAGMRMSSSYINVFGRGNTGTNGSAISFNEVTEEHWRPRSAAARYFAVDDEHPAISPWPPAAEPPVAT